jgi:hypothetical protein
MFRRNRAQMDRLRARSSVACFGVYALLALSFWVAGTIAYWRGATGTARALGLLFLPSLALPLVGRGELAGLPVESSVWWWWFAAQVAVAATAIWLYPYDRVPRTAVAPPLGGGRVPVSLP